MARNKSMDFDKDYGTIRAVGGAHPGVKYVQGDSYYDNAGGFVALVNPEAKPAPGCKENSCRSEARCAGRCS